MITPHFPGARVILASLLLLASCARPGTETPSPQTNEEEENGSGTERPEPPPPEPPRPTQPAAPPRVAMLAGLMPLTSTGVDGFLDRNPAYDGRGVVIGILDSGVDLNLPGLATTTTGQAKVLDARDFSREGRISLQSVSPRGDTVTIGEKVLGGFGRVAGFARPPYYGGLFHELPLGEPPASDVNGNGTNTDVIPVLVVRTTSGWATVVDTDNDASLEDEVPIHDYSVAAETFTIGPRDGRADRGPLTIAVNVTEDAEIPVVDLFFDNSAHGSHVSGIAAGHNLFGVEGFNGVAPGAQILALKIANNARGGISVTGSMVRAMQYAVDFASQRGLPLVLNMSFGVGNQSEGSAAIDSIVDRFLLDNPDVLFVISAGNDGPGISTVGFPGSSEHALSVCALFPGVFTGPRPPGLATDGDAVADFSARGGELAKPDLCAPGLAFSNVPRWNLGEEVAGGTSMAAPHVTGLAALLQSGRVAHGQPVRGIDLKNALLASSEQRTRGTAVDLGVGVPEVGAAYDWLVAGHQAGMYSIRAMADGGNLSRSTGAYRRSGLASPADTIQRFVVRSVAGQPAAELLLESDAPWLRVNEVLLLDGTPATVTVTYDARELRTPGLYVGSVWATPATDTLAGPAFRLTNTVVVPRVLDRPFTEGRDLGPGRIRRYFFDVPANAGGLTVEMELRYRTQRGSLYLFEPSGQPYRGGSSLDAGGGDPARVRMVVGHEDLVPGVYEAVVVAPAASAASFQVRAALPRYVVDDVGSGPTAVIRKRANVPTFVEDATVFQKSDSAQQGGDSVEVKAELVGATRTYPVNGTGQTPHLTEVRVPEWANRVELDVRVSESLWNQMTDLGVTVFDSSGAQIGQGPLSYEFGRAEIDLRRAHRNTPIRVELFPGFAHPDPPASWSAEVTVRFLARSAVTLASASGDSAQTLLLAPGETIGIQFTPPEPAVLAAPEGFAPLVRITATPEAGPPATRRGPSRYR